VAKWKERIGREATRGFSERRGTKPKKVSNSVGEWTCKYVDLEGGKVEDKVLGKKDLFSKEKEKKEVWEMLFIMGEVGEGARKGWKSVSNHYQETVMGRGEGGGEGFIFSIRLLVR